MLKVFNCFITYFKNSCCTCRVVLSEAVDGCIWFTRKIQHGGDWRRSRPQGPKNVHNFLLTVRPLSWACGHGTEMLLILRKLFLTWLLPDIFRYDSPKKCPTILYAVNLWLKHVSATGDTVVPPCPCTNWNRFAVFLRWNGRLLTRYRHENKSTLLLILFQHG